MISFPNQSKPIPVLTFPVGELIALINEEIEKLLFAATKTSKFLTRQSNPALYFSSLLLAIYILGISAIN